MVVPAHSVLTLANRSRSLPGVRVCEHARDLDRPRSINRSIRPSCSLTPFTLHLLPGRAALRVALPVLLTSIGKLPSCMPVRRRHVGVVRFTNPPRSRRPTASIPIPLMRSIPDHPMPTRSGVASAPAAACLPPGTPTWITPDLVHLTLKVWQPFYSANLSVHDAITILLSVGRLFRALSPVPPPRED